MRCNLSHKVAAVADNRRVHSGYESVDVERSDVVLEPAAPARGTGAFRVGRQAQVEDVRSMHASRIHRRFSLILHVSTV